MRPSPATRAGRSPPTDPSPPTTSTTAKSYDARKEMPGWARPASMTPPGRPCLVGQGAPGVLTAQPIEPIRVVQTSSRSGSPNRRSQPLSIDLGQNMVGWVRFTAPARGRAVQLRHAEILRPDGRLYIENLRTARATDLYTMKGGAPETYEPRFIYHGFRYVEVTTLPGVSDPSSRAASSRRLRQIASFESSNPLLNQIHSNIVWGAKDNYRSIPTDCPQRDERRLAGRPRRQQPRRNVSLRRRRPLRAMAHRYRRTPRRADGCSAT